MSDESQVVPERMLQVDGPEIIRQAFLRAVRFTQDSGERPVISGQVLMAWWSAAGERPLEWFRAHGYSLVRTGDRDAYFVLPTHHPMVTS